MQTHIYVIYNTTVCCVDGEQ